MHAADCRDIAKDKRGAVTVYSIEAESCRAVAEDFYSDFIGEGSMTSEEALQYSIFLPCCKALPMEEAK